MFASHALNFFSILWFVVLKNGSCYRRCLAKAVVWEAGSRSCLDAGGPGRRSHNQAGGWWLLRGVVPGVRGLHGPQGSWSQGSVSQATSLGQGPPVVCGKTAIKKKYKQLNWNKQRRISGPSSPVRTMEKEPSAEPSSETGFVFKTNLMHFKNLTLWLLAFSFHVDFGLISLVTSIYVNQNH